MKRAGFTMIELIFVIVILGILAAVAVPKLAATRDDAKVAKGATELATFVGDVGSYYTSKGGLTALNSMSNVFAEDSTDFNTTGNNIGYEGCITFTAVSTLGAGNAADGIIVNYTSGGSSVCQNIALAAVGITGATAAGTDSNKTHTFGGTGVVW